VAESFKGLKKKTRFMGKRLPELAKKTFLRGLLLLMILWSSGLLSIGEVDRAPGRTNAPEQSAALT